MARLWHALTYFKSHTFEVTLSEAPVIDPSVGQQLWAAGTAQGIGGHSLTYEPGQQYPPVYQLAFVPLLS